MADDEEAKLEVPQQRSPAFPYITLDVALERAKIIFEQVRDHAQPREVLAKAYGKPVTSSATIQTFATLLQYGLLQNVLGSTGRRMKISPLAQSILNPHAPREKIQEAIKVAALTPAVFRELWEKFRLADLNDSVPLYYLTSERAHEHGMAFTDKAARDVLRVYRATLSFAGIAEGDNSQVPPLENDGPLPPQQTAKVGDLVQVEVNGAFVLPEPKRVRAIQQHEGQDWVFIEGSETGFEVNQIVLQEVAPSTPKMPPRLALEPVPTTPLAKPGVPEGWSEETLIDDGGDEIKIRYLGKASVERYKFIRDYLTFKIDRLEPKK